MDAHSLLQLTVSTQGPFTDNATIELRQAITYCEEIDEQGIIFMLVLELLPQAAFYGVGASESLSDL